MEEAGKARGIQVEETGFFTRVGGVVPKIGPLGEFMTTLSSLTERNPSPKEVIRTKGGYFVVRLSGFEPADQSKFPSLEKDLQKRLIYQKQEESLQNWLRQLRAKAKIEINKDVL
jgi:peptidyl-prolyl cis-trans isomerase D